MQDFDKALKRLNPQQLKAVETISGPVLVVAGPGTGKTQVLALRIANILKHTDASPSNILCLTFTESGVVAMRERLVEMIGVEGYQVRVHTFHSFCNEVIQTFPESFMFTKELKQLDDITRIKIVRKVLDSFPEEEKLGLRPFYDPYYHQKEIISGISSIKNEGVGVEEFAKLAQEAVEELEATPDINPKTKKPKGDWINRLKFANRNVELAKIYRAYQEMLTQEGLYDYEDMLEFVTSKFMEDDALLGHYQERFLYILVDEYQDTNGAQNKLLMLLASFDSSPNLFAVGDDDQAIYRFQGANVGNLLSFSSHFQDVATISITTNYRSSQVILDAAASLIAHNQQRLTNLLPDVSKKLHSAAEIPDQLVEIYELSHQNAEVKFVIDKIKQLNSTGVGYGNIAILYRRHRDADEAIDALLHAQIPIDIASGDNALDSLPVKQFLLLLEAIADVTESGDKNLAQVLFFKFLGLDRLEVFQAINQASKEKRSLMEIIIGWNGGQQEFEIEKKSLGTFGNNLLRWKQESANLPLHEFLQLVAEESGFLHSVFASSELATLDDMAAVTTVFDMCRRLNYRDRNITLLGFLDDIRLLTQNKLVLAQPELEQQADSVHLMTTHAAKGREFDHVFVIGLHDNNWGGGRTRSLIKLPLALWGPSQIVTTETDLEDERRLLFVAMTRAKRALYLSYAHIYMTDSGEKEVAAHPFLQQIDGQYVIYPETEAFEKFEAGYVQQRVSPIKRIDYSVAESQFLQSLVTNFKMSPSALNEYIECPLRFKFNRLLRIPRRIERSQALGVAVHFALEHSMRKLMKGEKLQKSQILHFFEQELGRQQLNDMDLRATFAEGRELLSAYFEAYTGKWDVPVDVEYGFYGRELILEASGISPIPVTGKLDKVTWVDKAANTVRVTDYKTMSHKSENEIKGVTKGSNGSIYRQLLFYKLLGELDDRFRPAPGLPKYKIVEAEVDFIKPNDRGAFRKEVIVLPDEDVDTLRSLLIDVMKRIRNLEFGGSEAFPLCGKCEYCQMDM